MDPRFLQHFQNPQNVGRLERPSGTASVQNPVCGDELVVDVALAEGRLTAVRWKARGCSGTIAAASALSELARGARLEEAEALGREAVEAALGGLPTLKAHGADLAIEGLRAALAAARGE